MEFDCGEKASALMIRSKGYSLFPKTMKNSTVCEAVEKAHDVLKNNHFAFLQSTIFLLRAERAAVMNMEADSPAHSGFKVTHEWLAKFASKMGMSGTQYIESHLFFTQISGLEFYFQSCLAAVLKSYPKKLGSTQFTLTQILQVETKDELVERAADMYLNKLMYKKPAEYLAEMCEILSISSTAIEELWPFFVESKARRDLGIHNNWQCNETYVRKLAEVGLTSQYKIGESVVPSDNDYFTEASHKLARIGTHIHKEIISVYGGTAGSGMGEN